MSKDLPKAGVVILWNLRLEWLWHGVICTADNLGAFMGAFKQQFHPMKFKRSANQTYAHMINAIKYIYQKSRVLGRKTGLG